MGISGGKDGRLDEFSLIDHLFAPLAGPGAFELTDDAALVKPRAGCDLVLTKDAIAEGRHYLASDPAGEVAQKLLRVNLSDLAAKGAQARGYLLACAWSEDTSLEWMESFAEGLARDQERYGISLLGGDTIKTKGPGVFSLTAIGDVPTGGMVRRVGAEVGDELYVTGTIGDAALGLLVATGALVPSEGKIKSPLLKRYRVPEPPVVFGRYLAQFASAALDVSDGLLADLRHLCEASGVGAVIERDVIPLSTEVSTLVSGDPGLWQNIVCGGDDYQILFCTSAGDGTRAERVANETGVRLTRLGRIVAPPGVGVRNPMGDLMSFDRAGFSHF